jgi:hypothetical protein
MRIFARNHAAASSNKVHDPEFARSAGFRGGLLPGVDVYAYLTRVVMDRWVPAWLASGGGEVRFVRPVCDGDELELAASLQADQSLMVLARCGGEDRALLMANLDQPLPDHELRSFPERALPEPKLRAHPESFSPGEWLGSLSTSITRAEAVSQLTEVGETTPVYSREQLVHPGHLLRFADSLIAANVDLPPWMHVGSVFQHHGLVHWDERISVRARVVQTFERKGHDFVQLDVLMLGEDGSPRFRVRPYTAIYRPAFVDPAPA